MRAIRDEALERVLRRVTGEALGGIATRRAESDFCRAVNSYIRNRLVDGWVAEEITEYLITTVQEIVQHGLGDRVEQA